VVIAEKVRLNDAALICGMADEVGGVLVVLDELLPQAAASRAALAATAVSAIVLLLIKPNETTSFVGLDVRTQMGRHGPSPLWAGRATGVR